MYFPRAGKKDRVQVDHSFPWDDWIHKATVIEIGFYTCLTSNATEQILQMTFGGGYATLGDLFLAKHTGRRPKK